MAQRTVTSNRSGTRALRRVAHDYLRRTERCLATPALSDDGVHDARLALKRSRTALRLLRPALGAIRYQRENAALRDAGHALNAVRDASVLVGTLESLRESDRRLRDSRAAAELARELQGAQSAARHRLRTHQFLEPLRRSARGCERRSRRWPVGRHGWSVIGPALRRIYGLGRRAMPASDAVAADGALHEWRKQVTYLRYALQILAPIQPGPLGRLVRRAKALSDQLGEAHDLAVLARHIRAGTGTPALPGRGAAHRGRGASRSGDGVAHTGNGAAHSGNGADLRELLVAIERRRVRLAREALAAGRVLYRAPPRAFARRIGRAWQQWRKTG
ncbi:MAG TPA: CHAD domain-containing protein [Steroidobacteraceae bacterium]|nr:CHAD domain-containing protein [Steroidobacteraceae bacterium]